MRRTRRSHTKLASPKLKSSAGSAAASPADAGKHVPSGSGSAFTVPLAWEASPVGAVAGAATRSSTQQEDDEALALPGACREEAAGPVSNSMANEQMKICLAARQQDHWAGQCSARPIASMQAGTATAEPEHGSTVLAPGSSLRLQGAGAQEAPASAPCMHPKGMSQQARRLGSARLAARRRLCMSLEMRLPAPPWGAAAPPRAAAAAPSAAATAQPACVGQKESTDRPGRAGGGAGGGGAAGSHAAGGPVSELPAPEAPGGRGRMRCQLEVSDRDHVCREGQAAVAHGVDPAADARPDPSPCTPLRSAGRGSEPNLAPCAAPVPVTCAAPEPVSPVIVCAEHPGPAPFQTPSTVPGACDQIHDTGPFHRLTGLSDRQGWGAPLVGEESGDSLGASLHVTHADMGGSATGAALGAVPERDIGAEPDVPAGTTGALAVSVRPPACTGTAPMSAAVPLVSVAATHGSPVVPLPSEPRSNVRAEALDCQQSGEQCHCATPTPLPAAGSSGQPTQVAGRDTPQAQATPDSGTQKAALRSHRAASGSTGQCASKPGSGPGSELAALRSQVAMAQFAAAAAEAELVGVQRMRDHLAERVAGLTAQRMRCACQLIAAKRQKTWTWHKKNPQRRRHIRMYPGQLSTTEVCSILFCFARTLLSDYDQRVAGTSGSAGSRTCA